MNILPVSFYTKDTLVVARNLLGKILFRRVNNNVYRGMIVETEAYLPYDPAAHSFKGYTKCRDAIISVTRNDLYIFHIWYVLLFQYCYGTK